MAPTKTIVFLFDVDGTLLDNDRIQEDIQDHMKQLFGAERSDRYWLIQEEMFQKGGYRDYLGALQLFRDEFPEEPLMTTVADFILEYPYSERLYPGALEVLEKFRVWGCTAILTDGDVVFQPRKLKLSGLHEAVDGNVLIRIHKEVERSLADVERHFPADHYVMVDDKPRILDSLKKHWGSRVTTVLPMQGKFANDPQAALQFPVAADLTVGSICELRNVELLDLIVILKN